MGQEEIRVPVKGGYIVAGRNLDPDYDGVYVVFETCEKDIMDLVLVECKKENEYEQTDVYCYEDVNTEDWTKKYSIQHEDIYEALGEKYNGKKVTDNKVYVINGYSRQIGHWEVELLASKEKAEKRFNNYVEEYEAIRSEDDEWYATCDDGVTWMSLEEREIEK